MTLPTINVTDPVANESDGHVEFLIWLSEPSGGQVTVDFNTQNGSASFPSDRSSESGTLTFAPGETQQLVYVALTDDGEAEVTENFRLTLYSPSNGVLGKSVGEATIYDDDGTRGTPLLVVRDVVVDEMAGRAFFTLTLDRPSAEVVSVDVVTADGTAVAGSDYEALGLQTVSFTPGERAQTVVVNLLDDTVAESGESFDLVLSNAVGATLADDRATAYLGASDQGAVATPTISVNDVVVSEDQGYAEFVVSLSAPGEDLVAVKYAQSAGLAGHWSDYISTSGTLTFAPGETVKMVRVALVDDADAEGPENFNMVLSSPGNGVLGKSVGEATIYDDDGTRGTPLLVVRDVVVDEMAGRAFFTLTLDRPSAEVVSVDVVTADGTAVAGSDYEALGLQTVSFTPGERAQTVVVNLLDDTVAESGESFDLVLSNAVGATLADDRATAYLGASDQGVVTTPTINVNDVVVSEDQGYAEFVVRLSAPGTDLITVQYSQAGKSAEHWSDFDSTSGTLIFAPGETVKTVRVPLIDDAAAEFTENFAMHLANQHNGVLGNSEALATILDDDGERDTPVVVARDVVADEIAGRAFFTLTLDRPSAEVVSVDVVTADGTALAGSDYEALGLQTVSFAPGERAQTVVVNLLDDAVAESGESFDLVLSNALGATLGDDRATAYLGASDQGAVAAPTISVNDVVVSEDQGYAEFVVSLSAPATDIVKVKYYSDNFNSVASYFSDYSSVDGIFKFLPGETVKTIRVGITDDNVEEETESFELELYLPSGGVLGKKTGVATIIDNDGVQEPPLKEIDVTLATLAIFSLAAYKLRNDEPLTTRIGDEYTFLNDPNKEAEEAFNTLKTEGWTFLADTELGTSLSLTSMTRDGKFHFGMLDGIYTNENAGALVARDADSLIVAFRGTNDARYTEFGLIPMVGDSPDQASWLSMTVHWLRFDPLVKAVDTYLANHQEISKVYVTGHSLGAAMVQPFMASHEDDSRFEAVTFASPGYGGISRDNDQIVNLWVDGDQIQTASFAQDNAGDKNEFQLDITWQSVPPDDIAEAKHSMTLYAELAARLTAVGLDAAHLVTLNAVNYSDIYLSVKATEATITDSALDDYKVIICLPLNGSTVSGSSIFGSLIIGSAGSDVLTGGWGDDALASGDGSDSLTGGKGNDFLDGGNDLDTAIFSARLRDYIITPNGDDSYRVSSTPDGLDVVAGVERLQFSDQLIDFSSFTGLNEGDSVFRFYNLVIGTHFYTADTSEAENVMATLPEYLFEGAAFDRNTTGGADTIDVYRFYNLATHAHFYTADPDEVAQVLATLPEYLFEGVAYQAHSTDSVDTTELYRFYNNATNTHFYTADAQEAENVKVELAGQYIYEGVAYYVDLV